MEQNNAPLRKYTVWQLRKLLKKKSLAWQIFIHTFAAVGFALIAAWALYQTGITNDPGSVDKNSRQMASYTSRIDTSSAATIAKQQFQSQLDLIILNKLYPTNARLISEASKYGDCPDAIDRMIHVLLPYIQEDGKDEIYQQMMKTAYSTINGFKTKTTQKNVIPWMNDSSWSYMQRALVADKEAFEKAAKITGVDARLIIACTVGEQIRLCNSNREGIKRALGPATMMVNSQFSFGVNGIKDFTAQQTERNLKNSKSPFYMGKQYEKILDFSTEDIENERIQRLTDSKNHLYSYIYTGCILHQCMLQWKRAGFDVSDRPDILFTLFNLGFGYSKPHANPQCGGANISIGGRVYTFGAICNDFFYSGALTKEFPLHAKNFKE